MGGLDAEGDDPSLSGDGGGALASFAEFVEFANNVIGRQTSARRIAIAFGGEKGRDGHRKNQIAAHRHDVCLRFALPRRISARRERYRVRWMYASARHPRWQLALQFGA
jgi:hypothetical protein